MVVYKKKDPAEVGPNEPLRGLKSPDGERYYVTEFRAWTISSKIRARNLRSQSDFLGRSAIFLLWCVNFLADVRRGKFSEDRSDLFSAPFDFAQGTKLESIVP